MAGNTHNSIPDCMTDPGRKEGRKKERKEERKEGREGGRNVLDTIYAQSQGTSHTSLLKRN